ncbi:hypothetical protein V6N13_139561 [Hibiscus sabdariffa]
MSGRNRYPFTATQWEELQIQALIFKYMVSGIPIPPDLIFTIKRSFLQEHSSFSSRLFSYQPQAQHVGWNCFKGRKLDPELGRCRRTDGKKWRCSKQAYTDSKYCERHMHRGKNRSRKPVEPCATTTQSLSLSLSSSDTLKNRHELGSFIGLSLQSHAATEPSRSFSGPSNDDSWRFTPLTTSSSSSNHRKIHRFFEESSSASTSHGFPIFNSGSDNGIY